MGWDDWRLLLQAIDEGSLTAGAAAAGVSQATMSRRLAQLEAEVGHHLVDRTRGGLRVTDAGERLLGHARRMEAAAQELALAAETFDKEPEGLVTLAMPPGVATDVLAPSMPRLRQRFPRLRLRIVASATLVDLDGGAADLAVRLVRPTAGELVVRTLVELPFMAQASRAYVERMDARDRLQDLDWIGWPRSHGMLPPARWLRETLPSVVPVVESEDFLVQRAIAQAGAGVIVAGPTSSLVPIPLRTPNMPTFTVYLVLREALREVPRVRVVADFLASVASGVGHSMRDSLSRQVRGPC